ncbi:alanine racemase [Planctomycetota bacterium]
MKINRSLQFIRSDLQAHIYAGNLLNNVTQLKSLCHSDTQFCAVVKANAYGHGLTEVVDILKHTDIDFFAVASIYEALHISDSIRNQTILILEPVNKTQAADQITLCARKKLHCVVSTLEGVDYIESVLRDSPLTLNLHVNVETGMGRSGLTPDLCSQLVKRIDQSEHLRLAGVYTHFSTADEEDLSYAYQQLDRFKTFLANSQLTNRQDILIHAANSAATIKIPEAHFDMVRCGISMYGYYSRRMKHPPIELSPVMKLQAPIVQLKTIHQGESVGYGQSFIAPRNITAALVPIGYADGYWRCFSNCAVMKLGANIAPVIGRVCMDQLLIDVTDIPNAQPGQLVTVIDNDHDSPCGVYALSELARTICYEIPICVQAHVSRIVHQAQTFTHIELPATTTKTIEVTQPGD